MKVVVDSFKPVPEGQVKEVQSNGFYIGGEKYVTLRSDDGSLYAKKVRSYLKLRCADFVCPASHTFRWTGRC